MSQAKNTYRMSWRGNRSNLLSNKKTYSQFLGLLHFVRNDSFCKSLLLLLTGALVLSACQSPPEKETILAIFAHPDDETTIGSVLAKYGEAHEVYLILATDGRFGVTEHMGIPAGDSLVEIRKSEADCSCSSLGIHPPVFLGLQDGLGLNGHGDFYEQIPKLKERLLAEITRIEPTKILTFGPDGDTGHPDHRMIGALTTEVLLREGLTDKIDLYYFGWTQEQAEKYNWWELGYLDRRSFNTEISFSEAHEEKALESIRCYKSQYTAEEMEMWIEAEQRDTSNRLFFRKFNLENRTFADF